MRHRYTPRDYLHFLLMLQRNWRRQRVWGRRFEKAVGDGTFRMPSAAVVQLIPTETCNLRCPMCNQWGENGYFLQGVRKASHMGEADMTALTRSLSARDSLISVHGGEPFAYRHFSRLLEELAEKQFDVIITTNGTLIERHLQPLAQLKNLALLFSIDGPQQTHDRIRGKGRFQQSKRGLELLFEQRRRLGLPLPMVVMSFVVCEFNTDAILDVYQTARDFGVFALNFNLRWFLTKEVGQAYERDLKEHFGVRSTGAWRGFISNTPDHDYSQAAEQIGRLRRRCRLRPFPPYVVTTPKGLSGREIRQFFSDYLNVFGNQSCFMPFYWARIHSNGDLIYCPGHPDIIAGNVFKDGFESAFNSPATIHFRKHILENRFPICNRCCGLYMTYPARSREQKARRNLGLGPEVAVRF